MPVLKPSAAVLLAGAAALASANPAPAQRLTYDSAFAGYRAYQEPRLMPWKETNARIAAPASAPAPAPDPHAAHRARPTEAPPAKPAKPAHQHGHEH